MRTRKLRIVIRTTERIYAGPEVSTPLFCEFCGFETRFLPVQVAARVSGYSILSIARGVQDGILHFSESGPSLFICSRSLDLAARPNEAIQITGETL